MKKIFLFIMIWLIPIIIYSAEAEKTKTNDDYLEVIFGSVFLFALMVVAVIIRKVRKVRREKKESKVFQTKLKKSSGTTYCPRCGITFDQDLTHCEYCGWSVNFLCK